MAATPGEAAYEQWCEHINPPELPKQHTLRIQSWGKLRLSTRAVWEAIAKAAIKHHTKRGAR
ncbi:hypothetical protein LCGC14_1352340 [marine sediment metagenome]|uniref:Uncharacterized protein n=1 Tax=marine sediment metagenome TaxID=412755 RepID=A0A0F9KAH5_9ZZZZ